MKYGATLKTKTGPDKNVDEFFFLYDKPGGIKIGSIKETTVVGTYERTESRLLTSYAYVKLSSPLTYAGKKYAYAYIREASVYEYAARLTTYYLKSTTTAVNIRSTPSTASSKNIIGSLKSGATVGTTDGTTQNGFFLFNLAKGGTGWVSRNYITTTPPAGTPAPAKPADDEKEPADDVVISDPAGDSASDQTRTSAENALGTGWMGALKWIGIALIAIAIGIGLAKIYERRAKKR